MRFDERKTGGMKMDSPDQDFVEEFKPIYVPSRYSEDASIKDNVIYALGQLEYGTAQQVADKLKEYEPQTALSVHKKTATKVLEDLYEKGLVKGSDNEGNREYNLSKILTPNSGKADALY